MDEQQQQGESVIFQLVKSYLLNNYAPAQTLLESTLSYNTIEIYNKLQGIYPSMEYTPTDVALFLEDAGYIFRDKGQLNPEWLLKKKTTNAN